MEGYHGITTIPSGSQFTVGVSAAICLECSRTKSNSWPVGTQIAFASGLRLKGGGEDYFAGVTVSVARLEGGAPAINTITGARSDRDPDFTRLSGQRHYESSMQIQTLF